MAQSYHKMTDALQCSSYVTGMLNELSKQLDQKRPKEVKKASKSPKSPKTEESTFSLRNLLQSKVLLPGKLKKFQSFSLHNMKTIEAAVKSLPYSENSKIPGNFQCNECDQKWALNSTNWPEIARHILQNSGTFGKHLSPMIDQHLVILSTEENGQILNTLIPVLKCRKCKFYLAGNLENHACFAAKNASARSACALCNKRHAGDGPSEECGRALTRALALSCRKSCLKCEIQNSKAVKNKKSQKKNCENHTFKSETLHTVAKCFATLTNAFNEDTNDTIEELIVASKQKIL